MHSSHWAHFKTVLIVILPFFGLMYDLMCLDNKYHAIYWILRLVAITMGWIDCIEINWEKIIKHIFYEIHIIVIHL